ncbi:MAG TPA: 23S rRNA (adenine(2030)-N(6))-methyltransferase RlmJ [Steroidobacteraceae bacterium]|nr:23S rRNA (adenine(2030)-N(6))-methyltransferase RlmJ [Steroidobacteraceae bacterium]
MKYRHSFHAGNFADVHKHVALLALIAGLQRKDKGFLYLETHAGRGLYDLGSAQANHGSEARHGIGLVEKASPVSPEIGHYLEAVQALRAAAGGVQFYPGSPLLAARALRPQDRGIAAEIQAPECRALERALGGWRRMQAVCTDGMKLLESHLPPTERRALVLIDPPYEQMRDDFDVSLAAIGTILQRLANAVIAIWYPIKDERPLSVWLGRAERELQVPALVSELWLYPRDSRVALNGSGLLLLNPPYGFEAAQSVWLAELATILGAARHGGGSTQRWIVHEAA